jgi:hypothetical protein
LQANQLLRERSYPIPASPAPPKVDPQVAAIGPTQVRKRLRKRRIAKLPFSIVFVDPHDHSDPPHPLGLLCACRERPRRGTRKPYDDAAQATPRDGLAAAEPYNTLAGGKHIRMTLMRITEAGRKAIAG